MMKIYYTTLNNTPCIKPEPLLQHLNKLYKDVLDYRGYLRCPAMLEAVKNTFVIKSSFDYKIIYDKIQKKYHSPLYDQKFYDSYVYVRDFNIGFFNYDEPKIVFFSESDCDVEQVPPYYHNNDFSKNIILTGRYNIGRHFRKLETVIILKDGNEEFTINENDAMYYVKFHINEKIEFIPFYCDSYLTDLMSSKLQVRNYTKRIIPLSWYYEKSYRKSILKRIKDNILED